MDFAQSAQTTVPFGKFKGQTIDHVAEDDSGLVYLEWLRDQRKDKSTEFDIALNTYLADPTIQRECENANANRYNRNSW
jgi:hypothetical protein